MSDDFIKASKHYWRNFTQHHPMYGEKTFPCRDRTHSHMTFTVLVIMKEAAVRNRAIDALNIKMFDK